MRLDYTTSPDEALDDEVQVHLRYHSKGRIAVDEDVALVVVESRMLILS